jgi:hypothetical protein
MFSLLRKRAGRRLREPFGKAGLTVAVIALVFAMLGGAYAAGKLTSKQKKEVEKIAKKFQGTGPAGAQGSAGANGKDGAAGEKGATGPAGPQGPAGPAGSAGPAGADGKSVVSETVFPGPTEACGEAGGAEYEIEESAQPATLICSGEEGPQGPAGPEGVCSTANCTLPPGTIETGTFAFTRSVETVGGETIGDSTIIEVPISFSVPLAASIEEFEEPLGVHIHLPGDANYHESCEEGGGELTNPKPTNSGDVCIYSASEGTHLIGIVAPGSIVPTGSPEERRVARPGAVLLFAKPTENAEGSGTFAVKG